jgi:23S rRNA (cytidine1920-2'-O)/16S rRNA (cytidine1409-2'-O)-methyltransferase
MNKSRLDQELARRQLVSTRSQAESYIKLGKVRVNEQTITKAGHMVGPDDRLQLDQSERYVSRAALKLASVADKFALDFSGQTVLDVGSSTGGFTDYALKHGAVKVIAVDVGTEQLHPSLRTDPRVELHEKTDIRSLRLGNRESGIENRESKAPILNSEFVILNSPPDFVLVDVSFISLRQILPTVCTLSDKKTQIIAMVKPQFEANQKQVNKGVIKNDSIRRGILKDFETWVSQQFLIKNKADSDVAGTKGNKERFYLLTVRQP